jgi:hemolysin activation/secretion protein
MGDQGYLVSAELGFRITQQVKGVVFVDHGAAFAYKGNGEPVKDTDYITSFGFGADVSFTDRVSGRLTIGVPTRAEDGPPRRDRVSPSSAFSASSRSQGS